MTSGRLRDALPALALGGAGFGAIALAWVGLSTETLVAQQIAWFVSGAVTGLALIAVALVVLAVQLRRMNRADELRNLELATRAAREIAERLSARVSKS